MSSTSSYQYLNRLENAVRLHESWRGGECLNMIASENFSSPQTRGMLVTDFANRYTAPDKFYRGARFMDEVQALAERLAIGDDGPAEVTAIEVLRCTIKVMRSRFRLEQASERTEKTLLVGLMTTLWASSFVVIHFRPALWTVFHVVTPKHILSVL